MGVTHTVDLHPTLHSTTHPFITYITIYTSLPSHLTSDSGAHVPDTPGNMDSYVILVALSLVFLINDVHSQSSTASLCASVVSGLDCSKDPPRKICGTDGVTYDTSCNFAKVHCKNPDIHIKFEGECTASDSPEEICPDLAQYQCNRVDGKPEQICDNEGKTYDSFCEFYQSKCRNPQLKLTALGPCPTNSASTLSVFQVICGYVKGTTCPDNEPQVCGSDGKTYDSGCDLEKANCAGNGGLTLKSTGPC